MSDTKQLEALRDAVLRRIGGHSQPDESDVQVRLRDVLAALSPAPAKACSGFVCDGYDVRGKRVRFPRREGHAHKSVAGGPECFCTCGQPFSAHQEPATVSQQEQAQPLNKPTGFLNSEQAQQPAYRLVNQPSDINQQSAPSALPELVAYEWTPLKMRKRPDGTWCSLSDAKAYQRECERLRGLSMHCERCGADYAATGLEAGCPCLLKAECERLSESFQRIAEKQQSTYSKLLDTEQRAEQAERERDGARETVVFWRGQSELREKALKEREAELAALKAQHEAALKELEGLKESWMLCDSVPTTQHRIALAQAKREERERCAKVAANRWQMRVADEIRALGGEGE